MLTRRHFLRSSLAGAAFAALPPASAAPPPRLIDAHVHVFQRDPQFPYAPGSHPPTQDAPVETLIDLMRSNGVSRTVLIQVIHYKWDNSYVASVLKRYPKLFHAVCRVDPEDPAAPDHLSALTEQGFRGVRLSPAADATGDWIRGPLMPPLWRRCAELRVPMTLLLTPTRLPDIIPLLEANPSLTVVIDHMAQVPPNRPDQLKLLLALARYPRVFVKISEMYALSTKPFPYPDAQAQIKQLRDAYSASRLMWATNWPVSLAHLPYAQIVDLYRNHLPWLTPPEHQAILHRTAQTVWPFDLTA